MKIFNEEQILDPGFRKMVIKEIKGPENVSRKNEALKRYEIFKDNTKKWVLESLEDEGLREDTLKLMKSRASNISIAKKIIKKLARAYTNGVEREVDGSSDAIETLAKELDMNSKMSKADQYVQLQKNVLVGCMPIENSVESYEGKDVYDLQLKVLDPHQFDVIEYHSNREKAMVVILSDFLERSKLNRTEVLLGGDGRSLVTTPSYGKGDQKDQVIADTPSDQGSNRETFIWWSNNYHFTTDANGEVIPEISPEELKNPIELMPWVTLAEDQNGSYWAEGGDDLVDGSILINKIITDMYSIAFHQGWGQMVISGKDIPNDLPVGPRKALILSQNSSDDPTPQVYFANANPPLGDWMSMIEQFTALLLSTNNLSPRTVAGKLDGADPISGISKLIDQSESTVDVSERQKMYIDNEPILWEIIRRWQVLLKDAKALSSAFDEIEVISDTNVKLEFGHPQPVITEDERLKNVETRKRIGLDTEIDLIKELNPGMSTEDAEKKLAEIKAQKLQNMHDFMTQGFTNNQDQQSQDQQSQDNQNQNDQANQGDDLNGSVQNQS